jgi:hypothetical protein
MSACCCCYYCLFLTVSQSAYMCALPPVLAYDKPASALLVVLLLLPASRLALLLSSRPSTPLTAEQLPCSVAHLPILYCRGMPPSPRLLFDRREEGLLAIVAILGVPGSCLNSVAFSRQNMNGAVLLQEWQGSARQLSCTLKRQAPQHCCFLKYFKSILYYIIIQYDGR